MQLLTRSLWWGIGAAFITNMLLFGRSMALLTPRHRAATFAHRVLPMAFSSSNNDNGDNDGGFLDNEKKFTGRSLFEDTVGDSSVANRTPYGRELNLATNFQRTLPLQAALLFFSIVFAVYVGFTGGISDGSDRYFEDDIDDVLWLNGSDQQTVIYDDAHISSSVFI